MSVKYFSPSSSENVEKHKIASYVSFKNIAVMGEVIHFFAIFDNETSTKEEFIYGDEEITTLELFHVSVCEPKRC